MIQIRNGMQCYKINRKSKLVAGLWSSEAYDVEFIMSLIGEAGGRVTEDVPMIPH